jgi:hypothetical protein
MSKSTAKQRSRSGMITARQKSPTRAKSDKRQTGRRPVKPVKSASSRSDTKHARILAMLRAPEGATVAAMMTATHWQPHSVRGFLAGVVRRRLKLNLVSEPGDNGRVYRVKERRPQAQSVQVAST